MLDATGGRQAGKQGNTASRAKGGLLVSAGLWSCCS